MANYDEEFHKQFEQLAYTSAREVTGILLQFFKPSTVIDIGCSSGIWLSVWQERGVKNVLGVDGDYVNREWLKIPQDCFMPFDLQQPLKLDRTFDLASTLEVAEHIPPELADQFVDMMVRLAPIVLFSAAVPDQGGVSHVNEQWQDYWAKRFAERQYVAIDCIRPRVWRNQAVSATYRQNILLYVRHDYLVTNEALQRESDLARPEQLSIIHPEFYSRKIKQMDEDISFKRALKMLPHAFAQGVLRRFSSRN